MERGGGGGGTKLCLNDPGYMTKMAATHIHGKYIFLLQNVESYDLET